MSLTSWYHYYNTDCADERTSDWFLIRTPVSFLVITFCYLYFVLRCGPRFMKDRKPYSLKNFIRLYNLFQIVSNAMIVYHIFEVGWYQDYFFYCTKIDFTVNPKTMKIATIMWYLLILKYVDYIETIVFVLRKKERQVSFLHVYHHVTSVLLCVIGTKYFISGMQLTFPVINSSVHVVMYTYYLLSSYGPKVQALLYPVKRMITIVQMVQFVIIILYIVQAFIPGCPQVQFLSGVLLVNTTINLYLFYRFYQNTYVNKSKKS